MNDSARAQLVEWIEADREAHIAFLSDFARIDTGNPPGDTRAAFNFLARTLDEAGVTFRFEAPQETMPNVIASFDGTGPGPHLVLNGHVDVFPPGDAAAWSRDPWSGEIADGRIHGRGTVDMKCGTTASIFTFLYLARLREALAGRLTLTLVSDEETGGKWGSAYLIDQFPDEVLGDCVLNGEPSSLNTVRFGEKGILWLKFCVTTPGGHSAYPHQSPSAVRIAADLIRDLTSIESTRIDMPASVAAVLAQPDVRAAIEDGLGEGAADVVPRITINFGTIQGGVKVNMIPDRCEFEADFRLPIGADAETIVAAAREIAGRYPGVTVEQSIPDVVPPNWCDPRGGMLRIVQRNAENAAGFAPKPIVNLGATDCRFWRHRDVPAYVYGCSPAGMGAPNESVSIDEFLTVLRVHALSAFDYLCDGSGTSG